LENAKGKFYIGQTADLEERLRDHNRTDCFDGHLPPLCFDGMVWFIP